MATTKGIRTWRRLSRDQALSIDERIRETTNPADMETAVREADFVTVPRRIFSSSGECIQTGYDDAYAARMAAALAERFGYCGQVRVSQSGHSHVFERQVASRGSGLELGLESGAKPAEARPAPSNGVAASAA